MRTISLSDPILPGFAVACGGTGGRGPHTLAPLAMAAAASAAILTSLHALFVKIKHHPPWSQPFPENPSSHLHLQPKLLPISMCYRERHDWPDLGHITRLEPAACARDLGRAGLGRCRHQICVCELTRQADEPAE
jgi:hypothetical protein